MRSTLILAAVAALAFASVADAKACKDGKGHFVKCPAAAAAPSKPMTPAGGGTIFKGRPKAVANASPAAPMSRRHADAGTHHCNKGKPCGDSCIPMNRVCHK